MWLEFLGQTEDETVLMREASMFVDVKLWGTEGWVCSASHRLFGEASLSTRPWEQGELSKNPASWWLTASRWVHVVVLGAGAS